MAFVVNMRHVHQVPTNHIRAFAMRIMKWKMENVFKMVSVQLLLSPCISANTSNNELCSLRLHQ